SIASAASDSMELAKGFTIADVPYRWSRLTEGCTALSARHPACVLPPAWAVAWRRVQRRRAGQKLGLVAAARWLQSADCGRRTMVSPDAKVTAMTTGRLDVKDCSAMPVSCGPCSGKSAKAVEVTAAPSAAAAAAATGSLFIVLLPAR